jgi:hypothetical protein
VGVGAGVTTDVFVGVDIGGKTAFAAIEENVLTLPSL